MTGASSSARTCCIAIRSTWRRSRTGSKPVLPNTTLSPASSARASTALVSAAKNGSPMVSMTTPMVSPVPTLSERAQEFGT